MKQHYIFSWFTTCLILLATGQVTAQDGTPPDRYDGTWESLQKMPVPAWFDDGKIGIFIHWGPYSAIGYRKGGRGYAEHVPKMIYEDPTHYYPYMKERWGTTPPDFGYKDIIPEFKAENWDPDQWAKLFAEVGAKYVVLTAEHHDGWANWDSDLTPWNAVDKGPHRDLVGDLGKAVRKLGLKYAPSYHRERHTGFFAKEKYVVHCEPRPDIAEEIKRVPEAAMLYGPEFSYSKAFVDDYVARWKEIQTKYQPDFLWVDDFPIYTRDGNEVRKGRMKPEIKYLDDQVRAMITDFMNEAATRGQEVYCNNKGANRNWPDGVGCLEKDNLKLKVIGPKWQSCTTFGTSFGYLEGDTYKTVQGVIHEMIEVVSRNGNFLINIGPRADGTIPEPQVERLRAMGTWLTINGDAIYGTRYWKVCDQEDERLAFTTKGKTLYAIKLTRPSAPFTISGTSGWEAGQVDTVRLLGSNAEVDWSMTQQGLRITPPADLGRSMYAWAFEIVTDHQQHSPNVIQHDATKALQGTKKVDLEERDTTSQRAAQAGRSHPAMAPFVLPGSTEKSLVVQRADGCVVMDAGQAQVEGNRSTFGFELTHPGEYTVQVITRIEDSTGNPSPTVDVQGKPLSDSLTKAYVIEEGVVSEFEKPATFTEAGRHTLSLRWNVAPAKVRLVPQIYTKSRIQISSSKYYDTWLAMHQSPEKQAALARFQAARFGMFIHWGVYSVAAGSWKGVKIEDSSVSGPRVAEWLMFTFSIPREEYREFAKQFNPDKSFAANIARLAKEAGMKYVVITSKHHDGFGLFDSACSDFDVTDACPYDGDLIKELYAACRAEGLDFAVYYSHGHDWMDGCDANYANVKKYNDTLGVPTRPNGKNLWDPSPNSYLDYLENKAYPQIAELIRLMPDLSLIWFDGEGLITEAQAFRFYKMIYDLNPNIIVNRRIGYDFGDYVDAGDNKTPAANELAVKHFETCGTANHSWGFKAHDHNWKSTNQLLRNFVDIVSKGGNYLLNIGPDGKGQVPEPCVNRFREMGSWVKTNADAIFGTTRWSTFSEGVTNVASASSAPTEFWFSARDDKVYAMSLVPGTDRVRILSLQQSAGTIANVRLLGSSQQLKWTQTDKALELDFAGIETGDHGYAVEITLENQTEPPM